MLALRRKTVSIQIGYGIFCRCSVWPEEMGLEKEMFFEFGVKVANKELGEREKRTVRSPTPTTHTHTFFFL